MRHRRATRSRASRVREKLPAKHTLFRGYGLKGVTTFAYDLTQLRAIASDPMQRDFCESRAGHGPAPLLPNQVCKLELEQSPDFIGASQNPCSDWSANHARNLSEQFWD